MSKAKVWTYKPYRQPLPLAAKVVGEELERIREKHGELRPEIVVEESKASRAKLHKLFEWSDSEAATKWRVHQARNIINVLHVTYKGKDNRRVTVSPFVVTGNISDMETRQYEPIEVVMADPEKRRSMIEACLHRLLRIRDEYRAYQEFDRVWQAIDSLDQALAAV